MLGITTGEAALRRAAEAWSAYKGPRGGTGWQDEAGDVRYTDEMPGKESGSDERTVDSDSPAKSSAAPATDEPGRPATGPEGADWYIDKAQQNLKALSRTASGVVDTSASAGKAANMAAGSGDEAAKKAVANFSFTMRRLYSERDRQFDSPQELLDFVDSVSKGINKGITKEGVLLRNDDSDKFAYTRIGEMDKARQQSRRLLTGR